MCCIGVGAGRWWNDIPVRGVFFFPSFSFGNWEICSPASIHIPSHLCLFFCSHLIFISLFICLSHVSPPFCPSFTHLLPQPFAYFSSSSSIYSHSLPHNHPGKKALTPPRLPAKEPTSRGRGAGGQVRPRVLPSTPPNRRVLLPPRCHSASPRVILWRLCAGVWTGGKG